MTVLLRREAAGRVPWVAKIALAAGLLSLFAVL